MIKELINYYKLKKRADEITNLKITKDRFMAAKLTITSTPFLSDSYVLRTDIIEDEVKDFKAAVSKKIDKMIEELENKPL